MMRQRRGVRMGLVVFCAAAVTPLLCGGCPDVRNGVVDAFERATIAASTQDLGNEPQDVLQSGLARTFFEIFFDKLRSPRP